MLRLGLDSGISSTCRAQTNQRLVSELWAHAKPQQTLTQVYSPFSSSSEMFISAKGLTATMVLMCSVAAAHTSRFPGQIMQCLQTSRNLKFSTALPDQLRRSTFCRAPSSTDRIAPPPSLLLGRMTLPRPGADMMGALLDGSLNSAQQGNFCATCRQRRACRKKGAFKTAAMETRNRQANQQARRQSRKKGELPESGFFAQADPTGDTTHTLSGKS